MANKLISESSPYLLQHANNPVDWYPWGEEAFEKARAEDKPILLSIGYAACHWCHVMERESFMDESVAQLMNEGFVNIKVDREEHPDVDHLYMDALQAMTGAGGWPLNMFIAPDKKPFYGGTYFPPKRMYGRMSWQDVLRAMRDAWDNRREELSLQSDQLYKHLQQVNIIGSDSVSADPESIDLMVAEMLRQADKEWGGFGPAPKFLATDALRFLMEYDFYSKSRRPALAADALRHVVNSLDRMSKGGLYDQIEGGFSRYATDKEWSVPHFEKMLYDNALMIGLYSEAYQYTRKEHFRAIAEACIDFCFKNLESAHGGGFYSALDADSEGVEGKYYTLTWEEWARSEGHPAVEMYWGLRPEGNWEGTHIIKVARTEEEVKEAFGLDERSWGEILEKERNALRAIRSQKQKPATDDKILLSWNALFATALVKAHIAFGDKAYENKANQLLQWLLVAFRDADGGLFHVHKRGKSKIAGKLDDYAYFIQALLLAGGRWGHALYIDSAIALMEYCQKHFLVGDKGFFYYTSDRQTDILVRKVDNYDGATPSANAVMAENLGFLAAIARKEGWQEQAANMCGVQGAWARRHPLSFSYWGVLMQRQIAGAGQLTFVGHGALSKASRWAPTYAPNYHVLVHEGPDAPWPLLNGLYKEKLSLIYVCRGFSCRPPVTEIEELEL